MARKGYKSSRKALETWRTRQGLETLVVVRDSAGRFDASTNQDDKDLEIWLTSTGPVVKITARREDGTFRSATNYRVGSPKRIK